MHTVSAIGSTKQQEALTVQVPMDCHPPCPPPMPRVWKGRVLCLGKDYCYLQQPLEQAGGVSIGTVAMAFLQCCTQAVLNDVQHSLCHLERCWLVPHQPGSARRMDLSILAPTDTL